MRLSGNGGDDFSGGVVDVSGGDEREAGFREELASGFDVGAFEANDERDGKVDGFDGVDDALGDDVALHNAAEDIYENRFHAFVGDEDFEGIGDLLLGGAAANVEEVCGFAPVEFDDVHRGHREAGAVDEAGDVSIEANVAEVGLRGFDFAGTAEIASIRCEYECDTDGEARLVDLTIEDARAGKVPLSPRCPRCGAEMIPAQENHMYLRFLRY